MVCQFLVVRYQLDLCKRAVQENIIVYLGTGCGKTHIAVLLMYELGHLIRKPSREVCIFLAPTIPLVRQVAQLLAPLTIIYIFWVTNEGVGSKSFTRLPQLFMNVCNCIFQYQVQLYMLIQCYFFCIQYVLQQAMVIADSTNFKVQCYYGGGKNLRDHKAWENEMAEYEVWFALCSLCWHLPSGHWF